MNDHYHCGDPLCPTCDPMDDDAIAAAEASDTDELVRGLCEKVRRGDAEATAAVQSLLTMPTLPPEQGEAFRAALTAARQSRPSA